MVLSPLLKGEESREEKKSKTDNPNKPKGPIRPEAFALVINALCSICLFSDGKTHSVYPFFVLCLVV